MIKFDYMLMLLCYSVMNEMFFTIFRMIAND